MKKIKFKKFCLRLYIKLKKHFNKINRTIVDEREIKARSLAIKLIHQFDSTLKICPITHKRFVINERLNVHFIIKSTSIDFFGSHIHNVDFCKKHYDYILNEFDRIASKDREELELKIKSNVKHSFDDLYNWVLDNIRR